ncbi:AsmA family protein [Microbulbifer bruguierae]|uniref:AsmA family protein n=1 Tax=Microbulbifer bruguierae TaxID=3029061 RepID=A0ABY8N9Q1_9GAMM|nr:AsmA family protein [Microbulbifer bruguierae]WGL15630.1 AsmA family protein [Microbulbifer bruguierae]
MAWIKRGLITLVILFALFAGIIAWFLSGLDANQYKPKIVQLAADQGIALTLDGDIGWQIWPNIALKLEGVKVAPLLLPSESLLEAEKVAVGVALMPLLDKRIEATEITLLSPQVELTVDQNGKGNWELITDAIEAKAKLDKQQTQETPPTLDIPQKEEQAGSGGLELALEQLRLEDGVLRYVDKQAGSEYAISKLHISADNVVPGGKPGDVRLRAELTGSDFPEPVNVDIHSSLAIDEGLNGLRLQPANIKLTGAEGAKAEINLRGNVRRAKAEAPWQIQLNLNLDVAPITGWLAAVGSEYTPQSSSALKNLHIESDVSGTDKQMSLQPLELVLDNNKFSGSASYQAASSAKDVPSVSLNLKGGDLNVDDYLPPPVATPEENELGADIAAAQPVSLPLESMRGFNAKLDLTLDKLHALDFDIDKPQLAVNVTNGLYQLNKLAAGLYGGTLNSTGVFNARGNSARGELSGGLTGVEISKVQEALFASDEPEAADQKKVTLSGKTDLTWVGQTNGADTLALQKNLRAAVQLNSKELALAPFNLEKGMCQLVSYAEKTTLPEKEWPAQTRLQDLRASVNLTGDIAKVEGINAGIENIALSGDGTVDLEQQKFDFALGLALVGDKTSGNGCSVQNDRWRNRALPLRCNAKFSEAGATTCKPDSRRLDDLIRDELKYKAEKKYGDKVEEKTEEFKDKLKDKFKGLFNRDNKEESPPESTP